jgi:3-hydroxyisobutyrate dehydrogenase-like beta-hydroxyacid dehydrogenase
MVSVSELLINSEATTMSAQSDLDRSLMIAIGNHPNDSDNVQKLAASKLDSDLTPAMIYKDLRLLKEEMETLGMNPSLAHAVGELWQGASAKMGPDSPITSLMKLVECWSDVPLRGKRKKL